MDFMINLNDTVKVRLTDEGISIIRKQHDELNKLIINRGGKGFGEFNLENLKNDNEGYTTFQMWDLMNRFGEYMTPGYPEPFKGTMIFPDAKKIDTITIKGVKVPLCIRCGQPVKRESDVSEGDKPTARIICRTCYGK